ncbi:vacuolar sorting-associated 41 homolog, partial [Olea europaea subsp. europaea]
DGKLKAIKFLSMQHDASLNKSGMVGLLLKHTVGNFDPLYVVNMLPNDLEIPR